MGNSIVRRRLVDASERLKKLRAELVVADEQLVFLEEAAEESRMRALVSETPLADVEAREDRRHADVLARHRDTLARAIHALVAEQDSLLDRMAPEQATR